MAHVTQFTFLISGNVADVAVWGGIQTATIAANDFLGKSGVQDLL